MPEPVVVIEARPRFRRPARRRFRLAPRRRRTGSRTLVWVLVLLVVLWAALAARSLAHTRHELQQGRAALRQAKALSADQDIEGATAVPLLAQAATELTAASTGLGSRLLTPLRHAPVIGRQLRSIRALSTAGAGAASTIAETLVTMKAATAASPAPGARVALVRTFVTVATTAEARLQHLDLGPRSGLFTSVAAARNELAADIAGVSGGLMRGQAIGQAALHLLQGDHRVLLLVTNNAEMRAGSGIVDQLALLHVHDGHLTVEGVHGVGDVPVPAGAVPAGGDFGARWGWLDPTGDWQELLASPRFDVTGALAARMWAAAGQPPVDAVMTVDPLVLRDLLAAVGPVAAGGRLDDAGTILTELLHDQFARAPVPGPAPGDELGDLVTAVVGKVEAGGWPASKVGLALAGAARGRDLMVWAAAPTDEAAWSMAGAGGALGRSSVLVSLLNRGRDKLDPYVVTGASLDTQPSRDHTDATMTIVVSNRTPAGQAATIGGPAPGVASLLIPGQTVGYGDYVGLLAVSLPRAATDASVVGLEGPQIDGPDGPSLVVGEQYVIPDGKTLVVTVHFELPGTSGVLRLEPADRQPAPFWNFDGRVLGGNDAHTVSW
ncbi:MAG TPA: DUF4012 domain-containing protein [Acidimicrobiales bacterium]